MKTEAETTYAWLTAEDVLRHALAAYYLVCRDVDDSEQALPVDELIDPAEDCALGRPYFVERLRDALELRLLDHGYRAGLPHFDDWAAGELQRRFMTPRHVVGTLADQRPTTGTTEDIHCR